MSALTLPQPAPGVSDEQSISLDWLDLDEPHRGRITLLGTTIGELFSAVSPKLKFRKVRLIAADSQIVLLRRAGAKSKYPGSIHVTDDRPYGCNTYFGRIDIDGTLYESGAMTDAVRDLLKRFAANPREEAFLYGRLTGHCCFCELPLSDARSLAHGYGPVCAGHWGLPWDADRSLRGMPDTLYFTILAAKVKCEAKSKTAA